VSIELQQRLLVDQTAELHAGSWGGEPARIWMINPAGAGPAAVESTQRDLESLATLEEPALLPLTASGQLDDGRLWVAVPPEPDIGLHRLLRELGPLRLPQLRALARALCSALAALHQQGIVHGGLVPAMMRYASIHDDNAPPRLTGAGWASLRLAWLARSDADPDQLRRLAPELCGGQLAQTDRMADIFAAGCLLYEAATGRPAFAGETPQDVVAALVNDHRPDIRDRLGPAEEPLAKVLGRCLAVSPADRYSSVTALWRELAPALGGAADPLHTHRTGPIGLPADSEPPTDRPPANGSEPTTGQAQPAVIVDKAQARRRRGSGLLTLAISASAIGAAVAILLVIRNSSNPGDASDSTGRAPMAGAMGDPVPGRSTGPMTMAPSHKHSAGVPRPVAPRAGAATIDRLLARVGLTGGGVVVDNALALDYDLAVQALHDGKSRAFAEALQQIRRATRPGQCHAILRKKRFYIKSGIRTLSKRLEKWERFRMERTLSDVLKSRGGCKARSRRLSPLIEELRDRLVDKRAK
jgi:hypothetical protein